ncbi:MAG TPA: hypothetical protein VGO78_09965, partial [Acidimicrobiales bacterium]|nr:hypothetical protein [Acidimicrobiales bacterium]
MPATLNSLRAMQRVLTDQNLCGWPADRVTQLRNPDNAGNTARRLRELMRSARDTLVVYYAGQANLTTSGQLCLALSDTQPDAPDRTGLSYSWMARTLRDSPARRKVVILDCCLPGRTGQFLDPVSDQIADLSDVDGVYTLTSTTRQHPAPVVAGLQQRPRSTVFTGQLIEIIEAGLPGGPHHLTFEDLYPTLRQRLVSMGLPPPNQRGVDGANQPVLTRNVAPVSAGAAAAATGAPTAFGGPPPPGPALPPGPAPAPMLTAGPPPPAMLPAAPGNGTARGNGHGPVTGPTPVVGGVRTNGNGSGHDLHIGVNGNGVNGNGNGVRPHPVGDPGAETTPPPPPPPPPATATPLPGIAGAGDPSGSTEAVTPAGTAAPDSLARRPRRMWVPAVVLAAALLLPTLLVLRSSGSGGNGRRDGGVVVDLRDVGNRTISLGPGLQPISLLQDDNTLWVQSGTAGASAELTKIDLTTGEVVDTVPFPESDNVGT